MFHSLFALLSSPFYKEFSKLFVEIINPNFPIAVFPRVISLCRIVECFVYDRAKRSLLFRGTLPFPSSLTVSLPLSNISSLSSAPVSPSRQAQRERMAAGE